MIRNYLTAALFTAAASGAAMAADTATGLDVELGLLTCSQTSETNLIVIKETNFACMFNPAGGGPNQWFEAELDAVGLDLSISDNQKIAWTVLAPSIDAPVSGLEGEYYGAAASAAVGAGVGAKILVGGLDKSFALQPLSLSGEEGLGVYAGLEQLELKYVGATTN